MRYPIDDSMKVLGKKWAGPVLMELLNGHDRFNTLLDAVPGLNPRTLSLRLDEFENAGIVKREVRASSPARVHYQLTQKGEDMRPLLREVTSFSLKWYFTTTQAQELA
jgi:DNA-binding HxlR family transcriptional regulator